MANLSSARASLCLLPRLRPAQISKKQRWADSGGMKAL